MAKRPTITTVKELFALSRNVCALPTCDESLTRPEWGEVNADIAHIEGEREGAARWNPSMTDDERRSFPNLMLLCPKSHRLVDRLRPQDWPVERLQKIKEDHEGRNVDVAYGARGWATDQQLARFARDALQILQDAHGSELEVTVDEAFSWVRIVNIGGKDARLVQVYFGSSEIGLRPIMQEQGALSSGKSLRLDLPGRHELETQHQGRLNQSPYDDTRAHLMVVWYDYDGQQHAKSVWSQLVSDGDMRRHGTA